MIEGNGRIRIAILAGALSLLMAAGARAATVGTNFTSRTRGVNSSFIPPDTMGAVGPTHIVELINGRYAV